MEEAHCTRLFLSLHGGVTRQLPILALSLRTAVSTKPWEVLHQLDQHMKPVRTSPTLSPHHKRLSLGVAGMGIH